MRRKSDCLTTPEGGCMSLSSPIFAETLFIMLKDKVVVVTGGTDGIGKALTEQCLERGAKVATCGRTIEKLDELRKELADKDLLALQCDVSKVEDCQAFITEVIEHFGHIDILINNAGISMRSLFQDVSFETMRRVMEVNFWGAVYCTRFAMDSIIRRKGSIVGISSIAGYRGLPGRSGYSASKFAMTGWLEALRAELLETGVNVMWVAPGFTQSNVRKAALTKDTSAQGQSPLNEAKLMTAEACATQIINAIEKRKRTLVMTFQGKQTVFLNKYFPALTDKLTRKFFFRDGKLIK